MIITEEIYLPLNNKNFTEELLENILEGVSKEQKEIAQRAMNSSDMQILNRLKNYFTKRWETEKDIKKKMFEKKNFNYLWPIIVENVTNGSKNKDVNNYAKRITGISAQWGLADLNKQNSSLEQSNKSWPKLHLNSNENTPVDYQFKDIKKIKKIIQQEVILHEYGHLFEWIKEAIITGKIPEPKGTVELAVNGEYSEVEKLEGKANAYALENLYRKDRRELLKKSEGYTSDNIASANKNIKKAKEILKNNEYTNEKIKLSDLYKTGTYKNSKELKRTVSSIELENAYRSKELKKINNFTKNLEERFRKLGFKVPSIVCAVRNNYIKQHRDFYPLFTDENGRKIFIDIDAYKDLANNEEAMMFYLPHEMAHIISNENHGGKIFNEIINKWNKTYKEKIVAEPENEDDVNKKYLPTFFKKTEWFDKTKTNKEADEGIQDKVWKESYFPY